MQSAAIYKILMRGSDPLRKVATIVPYRCSVMSTVLIGDCTCFK